MKKRLALGIVALCLVGGVGAGLISMRRQASLGSGRMADQVKLDACAELQREVRAADSAVLTTEGRPGQEEEVQRQKQRYLASKNQYDLECGKK